jgi:hypothetical protein
VALPTLRVVAAACAKQRSHLGGANESVVGGKPPLQELLATVALETQVGGAATVAAQYFRDVLNLFTIHPEANE